VIFKSHNYFIWQCCETFSINCKAYWLWNWLCKTVSVNCKTDWLCLWLFCPLNPGESVFFFRNSLVSFGSQPCIWLVYCCVFYIFFCYIKYNSCVTKFQEPHSFYFYGTPLFSSNFVSLIVLFPWTHWSWNVSDISYFRNEKTLVYKHAAIVTTCPGICPISRNKVFFMSGSSHFARNIFDETECSEFKFMFLF
jgi:hypothetical protein